jgi:hypothetical protein
MPLSKYLLNALNCGTIIPNVVPGKRPLQKAVVDAGYINLRFNLKAKATGNSDSKKQLYVVFGVVTL